jgi:hypothetical protein
MKLETQVKICAFVLASNNFSKHELKILSSLFSDPTEIHFVKLKGSENGRKEILALLNHEYINEKHINCFIAHKAYAATAHIVDRLIEPVMYDAHIDIYKGGLNIAMTNYIYHFGFGKIWDTALFETMLQTFIKMIRKKGQIEVNNFYSAVEALSNHPNTKERDLIGPILESKGQIDEILKFLGKFDLDVTLSGFYILCDKWYKKTKSKLMIIQDDSKQIEHFREHIEFTRKLKIQQKNVGYDSRKMIYPTQISSLSLVSSNDYTGVQISDILASSLAFMYNNKNKKHQSLVAKIRDSRLAKLTNHHLVWPNDKVTPKQLHMDKGTGENVLDFLAVHSIKSRA